MVVSVSMPPIFVVSPDEPERSFTSMGDKFAEAMGYRVLVLTESLNARDGTPQRLYAKDGRLVFVEYLGPKMQISQAQAVWADELDKAAALSRGSVLRLLIRPADAPNLAKALSQ